MENNNRHHSVRIKEYAIQLASEEVRRIYLDIKRNRWWEEHRGTLRPLTTSEIGGGKGKGNQINRDWGKSSNSEYLNGFTLPS